MNKLIPYILLLCLWHSILFYLYDLGTNVVLFIIPLIIFITYALITNKKVKNDKAFLFIIPIILISCTYFIYDSEFFSLINLLIIPLLIILMYIFSIKPNINFKQMINDIVLLTFGPFQCVRNLYNITSNKISKTLNITDDNKKKIKSILIIIPIVIIVLLLLSSADMMFSNLFTSTSKIFKNISISDIICRTAIFVFTFIIIGISIIYVLFEYNDKNDLKKDFKIENYTIKLLLTILNIIYIIFDIIQIRSLLFHKVSTNINYAEYARSGFFQLMFISFINLIIILISKHKKDEKDKNYINIMSLIMIVLNFIIICSSFMRMYLYESTYGYTLLRLLVYYSLITETILLIPTIVYIFKSKINIVKPYIVILTTMYTILCMLPINYIIANNNINRYYKTNKIDIDYLLNGETENIKLLIDLYKNTKDNALKGEIKYYINNNFNNKTIDNFQDYNISKDKAIKIIKENENILNEEHNYSHK